METKVKSGSLEENEDDVSPRNDAIIAGVDGELIAQHDAGEYRLITPVMAFQSLWNLSFVASQHGLGNHAIGGCMSRWKDLESDFRKINDPFSSMRADWTQRENEEKYWRIAAAQGVVARQTFEALAKRGGILLLTSAAGERLCSKETLAQSDAVNRWLKAVGEITRSLKVSFYATEGEGEKKTVLLTGLIEGVVQNSADACLQLDAEDEQLAMALGSFQTKLRIFIEEIDNFNRVRDVSPTSISNVFRSGRLEISEDNIQTSLEEILGVSIHKLDWGGEENDLYTANIVLNGVRIPTAFLLKGPAVKSSLLQIADCGTNGDQIVRLFQSPAELFIVQYVGGISESVIKDLEGKVIAKRSSGSQAWYSIIDGQDTDRLLRAYKKL